MKKVSGNRQEGEKVGGGVGVGRAQEMHTRTHSVGQWSCKSRGGKSNMLAGQTHAQSTPSRGWEKPREQGSIGPEGGGGGGTGGPTAFSEQTTACITCEEGQRSHAESL